MPAESWSRSPNSDDRWALARGVLLIVCMVAAVLGYAWPYAGHDEIGAVCGVRLGMTEDQITSAFLDASAGQWVRGTASCGPSLEWTRTEPGPPGVRTRWSRFEIHEGMVVAIRVHTDDLSLPVGAVQTPTAVRQVRRSEGGSAVTVIARGCVTHAAEAEQIAVTALVE